MGGGLTVACVESLLTVAGRLNILRSQFLRFLLYTSPPRILEVLNKLYKTLRIVSSDYAAMSIFAVSHLRLLSRCLPSRCTVRLSMPAT